MSLEREHDTEPDPNEPVWTNTRMECDICGKAWVATHPVGCRRLQCPCCHYMCDVDTGYPCA
jgi:hypothetical protein